MKLRAGVEHPKAATVAAKSAPHRIFTKLAVSFCLILVMSLAAVPLLGGADADAGAAQVTGTCQTMVWSSAQGATCGVGSGTYTVPAGVTQLDVDVTGAAGGGANGQFGGLLTETIPVSPGELFYVLVGAEGGSGPGGSGGGGNSPDSAPAGGGGSFVFASDGTPIGIAGGGGGAFAQENPPQGTGSGGVGGDGFGTTNDGTTASTGGQGGGESSPGAGGFGSSGHEGASGTGPATLVNGVIHPGVGGDGGSAACYLSSCSQVGTGGGGGWYGGGGGGSETIPYFFDGGDGGGGSGYTDPSATSSGGGYDSNGGNGSVLFDFRTSAPTISGTPSSPTPANSPYESSFTLGGIPTPTTSVTSGSLPPGLSLSSDGTLNGTPSTPGSYTATVTASNGVTPNATDTFTIVVTNPLLTVTTTKLPTASRGLAYSDQLHATGGVGAYTWTAIGVLPTGLTLKPSGLLIGTPLSGDKPGPYPVTVKVRDSDTPSPEKASASLSIAVGSNVYISDLGDSRVMEVTSSGAQRTVISGLRSPNGVAVDSSGNVYVSETGKVDKITPTGTKTALMTGLSGPSRVAVDSKGDVFVADTGNDRVLEHKTTGVVKTIGSGISDPIGITVDGSGNVYVTENSAGDVVMITPTGTVSTIATGLDQPQGVAVDGNGDVYIAEWGNSSIFQIPAQGLSFSETFTGLNHPNDIEVDASGNLLIADHDANSVFRQSPTGKVTTVGSGLNGPNGVAAG